MEFEGDSIAIAGRVLDLIDLFVVGLDKGGRVSFMNRKAADFLGYRQGDWAGADWMGRHVPEEWKDRAKAAFEGILSGSGGGRMSFECDIDAPGGLTARVLWRDTLLLDDSGAPAAVLCVGADVTERRALERRYRSFIERMPLGLHAYRVDGSRLVFTESNPAADSILKTANAAFVGLDIGEAFPGLVSTDIPENYRRLAAEGGSLSREDVAYADEKIVGAYQIDAFQTGEGEMAVLFSDIAERKRMEIERNRFFELSLDLICRAGFDGYFKELNPAWERVLGWSQDELKTKALTDFIHPDDRERSIEAFENSKAGKRITMFENRYLRKDGGYSWLSWNAMTVPQEGVFIAVARDMTEYKETVELLRQSEKMEAIGQLAGGIAHDFNNQLAGIMGCAEMIEGASPAGSVAAKNARLILNAAGNSAELTKKLLAFARKGKYRSVGIDLNEAAREAVSLIERTIDKKVGIRLDLRSSAPFATGDPAQVQNALMNLCVNARDAMPGGGRLLVATRDEELGEEAAGRLGAEPGSYVAVDVKDTGEGLTEEARAHLFEPFFTTKPEGKGTGLGLAAVYGIMKSHHGAVRASSEKGKGTVFTLLFPRVAASAGEGGSAPGEAARAKGGRVLVVDDEEIIRTMACALLETGGYKAESAASGQDALDALAAKGCPDAIILDLSMPGMDGAEAFRLIRAAHPGARIIISSGYSMNDSVQTLMEGGAAIFVQKPYRKAELLAAVERAIGDRP